MRTKRLNASVAGDATQFIQGQPSFRRIMSSPRSKNKPTNYHKAGSACHLLQAGCLFGLLSDAGDIFQKIELAISSAVITRNSTLRNINFKIEL
jgi:hypothetical protein